MLGTDKYDKHIIVSATNDKKNLLLLAIFKKSLKFNLFNFLKVLFNCKFSGELNFNLFKYFLNKLFVDKFFFFN